VLQAALALIPHSLAVFPCRQRSKLPAMAHGCKDASTDPGIVRSMWAANPQFNLSIATGEVSGGLFVLDTDDSDGREELSRLEARHGNLPRTLQVCTPRGMHYYFRLPGVLVRNSASKVAPKIDVRGAGGYVLAPPSIHPTGRRYTWSVDSGNTIAEPPAWLINLVTKASGNGSARPAEHWRGIATNGVDEGCRDDTASRLAGHLFRHYVDPLVVLQLLLCWNAQRCRPPLLERDIERIVESVGRKELQRREGNNGYC
jgi:hypothetical protein